MRDVLPTLLAWEAAGHRFVTATVTHTWGSSPRPLGSVMGVREDGLVCGSVSGGCVESAVIEASLASLKDGKARELDFGELSDESVWEVGLSCGGRIQVWIDPNPVHGDCGAWRTIANGEPCVIATYLEPFRKAAWTPGSALDNALAQACEAAFRTRRSAEVEVDGERVFLQVMPYPERLIIVGAVHIAIPLIRFAKELGFETIVIDPRAALTVKERFPTLPDQIIAEWPDRAFSQIEITEQTYVVVLTHDPKIDDAALAILLTSSAAYIGALGSHTTQAKRRLALAATGFSDEELNRIHGPVGLNIGARTPEEIALSIIAQIVQVRRAKD